MAHPARTVVLLAPPGKGSKGSGNTAICITEVLVPDCTDVVCVAKAATIDKILGKTITVVDDNATDHAAAEVNGGWSMVMTDKLTNNSLNVDAIAMALVNGSTCVSDVLSVVKTLSDAASNVDKPVTDVLSVVKTDALAKV